MPYLEQEDAEDAIVTKFPIEVLKSRVYNPVSLMIGVTSNEGLMYVQGRNYTFSYALLHIEMCLT